MQKQKIRSASTRIDGKILHLECRHNIRLSLAEVEGRNSFETQVGAFWDCAFCPDKPEDGQTLSVVRKFFSFQLPGDFWERIGYERVVWSRKPDGTTVVSDDEPLEGYHRGLLVPYLDGRPVSLPEFDEAMSRVGLSRGWVLPAIEEMNAKRAAETRKPEPEVR